MAVKNPVTKSIMTNYSLYINNLAKRGENEVFLNSGPNHASMVMANIFAYSRKEVLIYAGSFSGEVSNDKDYLNALKGFLRRGGRVKILVQNLEEKFKDNPLYKLLSYYQKYFSSRVEIKSHPFKVRNSSSKKEIHFTVGDSKMFRVESDINKYIAYGNFNEPKESKILIDNFNSIFSSGNPRVKNIDLNDF